MIGQQLLSKIQAKYPPEKPLVFNYVDARAEMLALVGRIIHLEALSADKEQDDQEES